MRKRMFCCVLALLGALALAFSFDWQQSALAEVHLETEPNDTYDSAEEITLDAYVSGKVWQQVYDNHGTSNSDWYTFTLENSGIVYIRQHGQFVRIDLYKRSTEAELAEGAEAFTEVRISQEYDTSTSDKHDKYRSYCTLAEGEYYLKVYYDELFQTTEYKIHLDFESLVEGSISEAENSKEIVIGQKYTRHAAVPKQSWYKLTLTEKKAITVACRYPFPFTHGYGYRSLENNGLVFMIAEVYKDEGGAPATSNINSAFDVDVASREMIFSGSATLDAGTYYIKVAFDDWVKPTAYNSAVHELLVTEKHEHNFTRELIFKGLCKSTDTYLSTCTICGFENGMQAEKVEHTYVVSYEKKGLFSDYTGLVCEDCGAETGKTNMKKMLLIPVYLLCIVFIILGIKNYIKISKQGGKK